MKNGYSLYHMDDAGTCSARVLHNENTVDTNGSEPFIGSVNGRSRSASWLAVLTVLALMLLQPFSSVQAAVGDTFTDDNFTYTVLTEEGTTGTVSVGNKDGTSGAISIPATATNGEITYSVTLIGNYAFSNCSSLTSVVIPDSVTSIGNYAFYCCTSLTSVVIPDSVTSIGDWALSFCDNLTSMMIGNGVTSIGNYAFYYSESLTSVNFKGNAPTLGFYVFYNCPVTLYYIEGTTGWTNPYGGRPTDTWWVPGAPMIITQPQSQTVIEGRSVTLSIVATGTPPLSYQWYKDDTAISGETTRNYTINAVTSADVGNYTVTVSSDLGTIVSDPAAIAVRHSVPGSPGDILLEDSFDGADIDTALWEISDKAYETGTVSVDFFGLSDGQLVADNIVVTANYWGGKSIVSKGAFTADTTNSLTITVDVGGTYKTNGVAFASGVILCDTSNDDNFFAIRNNRGEGGWQYNKEKGKEGPLFTNWSSMNTDDPRTLVIIYDGETLELYLDGIFGGTVDWVCSDPFDIRLGFYAREIGAGGSGSFDGIRIRKGNYPPFSITSWPWGQTVTEEDSVTFSVVAMGLTPLNFQWYKNDIAISGATEADYTIASTIPADSGNYTVTVSDGSDIMTSSAAVLTVNPLILNSITISGADSVEEGATSTYTCTAIYSNGSSKTVNPIWGISSGEQCASIDRTGVLTGKAAGTVVVKAYYNEGITKTDTMSVTVVAAPVAPTITTQPQGRVIGEGGSVTFNVVATGTAPLSYQWKKGGTDISGATNASYTIAPVTAADAGRYMVTVSNKAGSVTSNVALLTVNPPVATFSIEINGKESVDVGETGLVLI